MDRRAAAIPGEYKAKAVNMDREIGSGETVGPCQRRLEDFGLLRLVWGGLGEGSQDVHTLVSILAECRIKTLTLRGEKPGPNQMGLEASWMRRRLSIAAIKAANNCLLSRISQVGEGSGIAAKRREWQRKEEVMMANQEEADRAARITGLEMVRRGMFWSK